MPVPPSVDAVVSHLVGIMDTSAQAAKNPKASSVRMTTCRVQILGAGNATYLYQEQALANSLDKPYRQRFLAIQPVADTVESKAYKVAEPDKIAGICA